MMQSEGVTTEAFLAAAARACDPKTASELLLPFVPEPPREEVDQAVLGPQCTGRTVGLFAASTSPLVSLVCMYVIIMLIKKCC